MKQILFVALLIVSLMTGICSAETRLPVSDLSPTDFIAACNKDAISPEDGKPLFPEPKLFPQASTNDDQLYVCFLADSKNTCMVTLQCNRNNKIMSVGVTTTSSDPAAEAFAVSLAGVLLEGIGLNQEEMHNIFGKENPNGNYATNCAAISKRIIVAQRTQKENNIFGIVINAFSK